ncbi:hypothetical protein [Streptomyces turgidiscabies]|uniref:hypothetical protein n=1 Tax=Streptomyces turgidiscabies TaxID=85558 RepID=UPI0038F7D524
MASNPGRLTANHAQIAQELTAHPYVWGNVHVYTSAYVAASIASNIRTASGSFHVYGPAGSFETRATPVEDGTLLEARYVLGIARALPALIQGTPDTEPAPGQPGADQFWPDAVSPLSPAPSPNGTPMTAPALPHDPYITAVVEALTAAGLEPDTYWTSDAEINPYDDGPDAGCTTMLNAVIGWDDNTDDNSGGLFLFWDHPAEQWQHARPRVNRGGNTGPEFLPKLGRWSDPAAVVATARALLANEPMPEGHAPYWHPAAAVRRAVDAWAAQE